MSDAIITREFPNATKEQAALLMLAELLETARDAEAAYQELLASQSQEKRRELELIHGLEAQITSAIETAEHSLAASLVLISEQQLEDARAQGLLSDTDYTHALTTKRTFALERESEGREQRLER